MTAHPFEKAGLGSAPFRVRGFWRERRACDYCGTRILNCFEVVGVDGRAFVVGCDCVRRTEDRKLVDQLKAIKREGGTRASVAPASNQPVDLDAALERFRADEVLCVWLRRAPHPNAAMAASGRSADDYCAFLASKGLKANLVAFLKGAERAVKTGVANV